MRITENQRLKIKEAILQYDNKAKIFLFGSRADDKKKGGDIDIMVFSEKINFNERINIMTDLSLQLDDFPIDLIVKKSKNDPFVKVVQNQFVEL